MTGLLNNKKEKIQLHLKITVGGKGEELLQSISAQNHQCLKAKKDLKKQNR